MKSMLFIIHSLIVVDKKITGSMFLVRVGTQKWGDFLKMIALLTVKDFLLMTKRSKMYSNRQIYLSKFRKKGP